MSVHGCGRGCGCKIYVSSIPGGGAPVSMPGASQYKAAAIYCASCDEYTCVSCAARPPALSPMHDCPKCGSPLSWPGVHAPSLGGGLGFKAPRPEAVAQRAAVASSRAAAQQMAGPSNTPATASLILAVGGSMCCLASAIPGVGCLGAVVNMMAIGLGALGMLKARATGFGTTPALVGIMLGIVNLIVSIIALVVVGLQFLNR